MTNSVPFSGTQSTLHLKSYRIVCINGEPVETLHCQNDLIASGSGERLVFGLHTVAMPLESSLNPPSAGSLPPGTFNIPVYPSETVKETDLHLNRVLPYSVSPLGQGPHTFSVTTSTLSLEGISTRSKPMEGFWPSLSVNKTHNAETVHLDAVQNMTFPYEQSTTWCSGILNSNDLQLNSQQVGSIGHQISGYQIPHEQVSSQYICDNVPYFGRDSLQLGGHQDSKMSTDSRETQTEGGVLSTGMDALDLARENYSMNNICCNKSNENGIVRDPIAEPSQKRLHMDIPYSYIQDKLPYDLEHVRNGETEVYGISIAPAQDGAVGWEASSPSNNDSGCFVEGSALSPNPGMSHEVFDVLETVLQDRVSAEVKMYTDSVREMLKSSQQAAHCADLEEEVFHSRYLLKMHQLAGKINRLIARQPFSP
ncbi:uncharacterized protein [Palaemon carinicauda]|uniref:uncharacterized protein n=1 Tax=Palaemon carinicauda TaxID=392227 RepID=UPI0035B66F49